MYVSVACKVSFLFNACVFVYCFRIDTHPNVHLILQRGLTGVGRGDLFLSLHVIGGVRVSSLFQEGSEYLLHSQMHMTAAPGGGRVLWNPH